eukprot:1573831-Rhodomonas_salina.1
MKYMGLARLLYANEIPLIGIASYGIVKGAPAFAKRDATAGGAKKDAESETPAARSRRVSVMQKIFGGSEQAANKSWNNGSFRGGFASKKENTV